MQISYSGMKINLAKKEKKNTFFMSILIKHAVEDYLNNINSKYLIPCNSPYPTTLWHPLHSIPFPCFLKMTKGPLHLKR